MSVYSTTLRTYKLQHMTCGSLPGPQPKNRTQAVTQMVEVETIGVLWKASTLGTEGRGDSKVRFADDTELEPLVGARLQALELRAQFCQAWGSA